MADRLRTTIYRTRFIPGSGGPRSRRVGRVDAEPPDRTLPTAGSLHDGTAGADPGDRRGSDARTVWPVAAAISLALAVLVLTGMGLSRHPDMRLAGPIALVVAALGTAAVRRVGRHRTFDLAGIALTGLGLKLIGVAARYEVIFGTYDGTADAGIYNENGARLAGAYRSFDFSEPALQEIPGTGFIRVVIGYVYAVFGSDIAVGFIAFGLFGFIGCFLLYRAFEIAMPDGNHRRYALLIFLWPSMLFWPSSLGKEAWIILALGVTAYGSARVLDHRRFGFLIAGVGGWGVMMTRPHIALFAFAAFAAAYFLRPSSGASGVGPAAKVIGLAALFVVSGTLLTQFQDFFGLDGFDKESIQETLEETELNSNQGGSGFAPPDAFTPVGFAVAVVTLVARPFPWEANNLQTLGTAVEGLLLGGLLVVSLRRVARASLRLRRWPYVIMALTFVLLFAFAFASIANFGILARQRTQALPFLFVLVCLPRTPGPVEASAPGLRRVASATSLPLGDLPR